MNSTPIWTANDIHVNINSPLSNSIQLPTFKVNMDTESVRSGYSDRSKRSRGHTSHSVTHSASNNHILIGNHVNSNNRNNGHNGHTPHHTPHHPSHHRSASRHSHRSARSDRYMISKLESPDERHEGQEVIEVQILPQDDNWGDNTTAVTGNTSDHSVSIEDINKMGKELWAEQSLSFRCQMWSGTVAAALLSICAFASPIVMVTLPRIEALEWKTVECGPECDGLLISFVFKLLILLIGTWAVFMRRPRATMPRIFLYRSIVMALVFVFIVAYWLFFVVRIMEKRFNEDELKYHSIVLFAVSLVDALLFIHYLAVLLIELRHVQPQYFVKVVRSPDGHSHCYNIGQLSIQRAAVWILERYYQDFAIYNPYLETLPTKKSRKSGVTSNHISAPTTPALKYYDVDGITTNVSHNANHNSAISGSTSIGIGHTNLSNSTSRAFFNDSANNEVRNRRDRTESSSHHHHHHHHHHHNERFYEEHEYERRVRKRKARLITATEEAFTHIKRIQDERSGVAIPMDPKEAAQAIFPSLARALQKYLRITRQQPRHTMQSILDHLSLCLSLDMSPKAFLEKYLISHPVLQSDNERKPIQTWSLVCDIMLSRSIESGIVFMLRQGDVSLLVTVHQLPHFNIVEEVIDPKSNKFVFRLNSETSV